MKKVSIRFIEESDLPLVQEYVSKKQVADTTNVPFPYPANGALQWFEFVEKEKEQGNHHPFAILYYEKFAGSISVRIEKNEIGAIDYWVAPPFWNKGVGTRAAQEAINYAVKELGLKTFETCCLKENPGSGRVLEKNGFRFVKEFEIGSGDKHEGKKANLYRLEM
ncbi:GNAT family N-acetyltransferase [Pseudalkalibacillus hwajinpoensis]|uniref:GNAT family N-acetyltransferase n=1 Tax=Guptibacillus hwajinpoensis TaxID=208199 RepID=UPI001CFE6521